MLGLPKNTEVNKPLPKTAIYAKFHMGAAEKAKVDADISRLVIVNEVSAAKLNLAPGETVQTFFVLQVVLKRKEFSEKTLIALSRLIPQKMVLLLEHEGQAKLAVYHTIIMPLVVPGLLAVGIYSFLQTWDDYLHAITLIRSTNLWTLSQGLKLTYLGEVSDWQLINAASTLGAIPMVFVFFFFQKYMIKGLVSGAVKG